MHAPTWEGRHADDWRASLDLPAVHVYETTPSTNDAARQLAESGAPHLTLVLADHQTQGRGRAGRAWLSVPGASVLCSVIFRYVPRADSAAGAAPVRIGHAVADAIEHAANVATRVKWPNDVVIDGHGKVAGILCEGAARPRHAYLVAGIGVNLDSPRADFASISEASERPPSRETILRAMIERLQPLADTITRPLSDDELAAIRQRDLLFGQLVEVENGLTGRAVGIARDGSLLVQSGHELRPVHNATVRLAGSHAYPGARA